MYYVYVFERRTGPDAFVIKHWPHGSPDRLVSDQWPNRYMSTRPNLMQVKQFGRADYVGNDYKINAELMEKLGGSTAQAGEG